MRQGARKENIVSQSLTDEQRRRIAKGLQPFAGWVVLAQRSSCPLVTANQGKTPVAS